MTHYGKWIMSYWLGWVFRWQLLWWEYQKNRKNQWVLTPTLVCEFVGKVVDSQLQRYTPRTHGRLMVYSQYPTIQELIEDLNTFNALIEKREYVDQLTIQHLDRPAQSVSLYQYLSDSDRKPIDPQKALRVINTLVVHNLLLLSTLRSEGYHDYYQKKSIPLYQNIYTTTETLAKINWS